ncbi:5-methylcytosine-specific restriction endonuclease McrA [Clostridium acetobutylicum]|uniref:Putative HNH nuclease YajD n=1 Tax=Clostridium acetobutylicum (strain ATCC 824 / DSM 792 / JCM 1419 / IAM 19013 / LMG 5710 / NBRC 13948 / NRRL B-527 / VKM B-1787 / 2291 / W) TaxID=272562 RepID=Q97HW0_CLOAB|nr:MULTISPECIES: HNH endonuclease signature motif containing protein [Clostridium]AAK79860.1 Phage-related, Zn finger domain containing protein [Clostridium acetobutylicum ATCC 824]ADZ20946.1 Phage-related, Zn finger domain containing protein [Clostridium acetobutylicum EA 2018]AEI32035.1 phage-related Zn finger domain-containing protein [Clostridium acetobutylicum DSM 1731]AWV79711.1 HNH endonuclease [Clostridium acetobutylicum]MBC2394312.1 HNH endonuclease [Clostridium acetobutylicum]
MARARDDIDKIYKSKRWQKVRKIVLIRDNYLCQECLRHGAITQANTVHHKVELREDLSKAYDIDNLESICPACHNKEHPERNSYRKKMVKRRKDIYKFYNPEI